MVWVVAKGVGWVVARRVGGVVGVFQLGGGVIAGVVREGLVVGWAVV